MVSEALAVAGDEPDLTVARTEVVPVGQHQQFHQRNKKRESESNGSLDY